MFRPTDRLFKMLVARADLARDEQRHAVAAELYEEALRLRPERAGLRVQYAHMLKQGGRFPEAERQYKIARDHGADEADLSLQLGHLYKILGRLADARGEYQRAVDLKPGWSAPLDELAGLARDRKGHPLEEPAHDGAAQHPAPAQAGDEAPPAWTREQLDRLVPRLAPRHGDDLLVAHEEAIHVRRMGRPEDGLWGVRRTLRGIEAVHGFILSETPVLEVELVVNGMQLFRGPLRGGYSLARERSNERIRKYVFNHWIDFSAFAAGLHAIELRFRSADGQSRSWHDRAVIAAPVPESLYPDSDFLIAPDPADPRPLERQIRTRPSQIHEARRTLFPAGVRNLLVMRTDQLGDMVASIPAMRRLRTLLPEARIVGLMTEANAAFARTLSDLFDEIITIDFPDVLLEQRRVMPLDQQEALRRRLQPYAFDIAIDLARADVSRDLLRLSGAPFLYGVGGGDWPYLSAEFMFNTHDRWTGHDMTPHSTKVLALVEALGTILGGPAPMFRREDLSRDRLHPYGIGPDERYVVLHLGARIGFSRWPYYPELTQLILERTGLTVVAVTEDAETRAEFGPALLDDPRLVFFDRRLPFDDFDALLSYATVMVGNDSGPKHLASLRGTKVVTIFSARINWTEWGQENVGVIISRKVPCAGCAILHEPENCGKDFACIVDIRPEEVFAQVLRLIEASEPIEADPRLPQ